MRYTGCQDIRYTSRSWVFANDTQQRTPTLSKAALQNLRVGENNSDSLQKQILRPRPGRGRAPLTIKI